MFERSVGKKPVPYIASSRTSTGGSIGTCPCATRAVEREAVEGEGEQRGVADQVAEARAGEPRGPLHLEPADLGVLRPLRRLARRRGGAPPRPRRCRRRATTGRAGSAPARAAGRARPRRRRAPPRPTRSSSFTRFSSSSCSGVGLPFSFSLPRSSSTRGTSSRQRSSAASSASNASAAPLRASAARKPSGSLRAARRSITRAESRGEACSARYASITCATPSSSHGGQTKSATASTRSCAFSTATP